MLLRGAEHENVFIEERGSPGYCDKSNESLYIYTCMIIHAHKDTYIYYLYMCISVFYIDNCIMLILKEWNNKYI